MESIVQSAWYGVRDKFSSLWQMIGNTPLIEIIYSYRGERRSVFAKCENYNLTGSIKDRMALFILQKAYVEEKIHEGDTIVETTSGNTGISFAALGKHLGHRVRIIIPDWLSTERVAIIRSLGAEVITVSEEEGGFPAGIRICREMELTEKGIFLPRQFENIYNAESHEKTGREIWEQLGTQNRLPHAFIAGVGTGGTVMGVGRYLKSKNKDIGVHPLEPAESPMLTRCKTGRHRIEGIADDFIPSIMNLREVDEPIQVHDGDAIIMAQRLAAELGLAVGISSGANFLGAVQLQNRFGPHMNIVTVFSDSNKKYLSTDLTRQEPVQESYDSTDVQLLEFRSVGRSNTIIL
jgi:cysteine synthase